MGSGSIVLNWRDTTQICKLQERLQPAGPVFHSIDLTTVTVVRMRLRSGVSLGRCVSQSWSMGNGGTTSKLLESDIQSTWCQGKLIWTNECLREERQDVSQKRQGNAAAENTGMSCRQGDSAVEYCNPAFGMRCALVFGVCHFQAVGLYRRHFWAPFPLSVKWNVNLKLMPESWSERTRKTTSKDSNILSHRILVRTVCVKLCESVL